MADGANTHTARWLLAILVLLVLYGSLYPFTLRPVEYEDLFDLVRRLTWGRTTRGDIFANVLLYLPLGAALAWALPQRLGATSRHALATLLGAALSLSVEVAQYFMAWRVATLSDVATNTLGTFLGCAGGLAIAAAARRLSASDAFRLTREPASAAIVVLWLASFLPPWLPPLDTTRWAESWDALLAGAAPPGHAIAVSALGWLVVGLALRALTRPRYVYAALAGLIALVLAVRFTVLSRFAGLDDALGAAAALVLWPLLARLDDRRLPSLLFLALLAVVGWRALEPFQFTLHAQAMNLVPFADLISRGSTGLNLPRFFEKAFAYGALVWLLVRRDSGALPAGLMVGAILLALEALQMWTPRDGHVPSVTDPVIALAAALMLATFGRR